MLSISISYTGLMCCAFISVGLIFAQFPKVSPSIKEVSDSPRADATPDGLTYTELGDGQVMDILKNHIESLKHNTKVDGPETKMVLFTGAIEHASRMCRVMVSDLAKSS